MQNHTQNWTRTRKLILMGYKPPSLNQLLHKHWTTAHRAKEAAKRAVAGALRASGSS